MRRSLKSIALVAGVLVPLPALAQDRSDCPPGSWFCESVEVELDPQAAPEPPKKPSKPSKPSKAGRPMLEGSAVEGDDEASQQDDAAPPARPGAPPVVIYPPPDAPPGQVVIVAPGPPPRHAKPLPPIPPPPPKPLPRYPQWGVNLHLEGIAMGHNAGAADGAGMGGLGLGLRLRPVPHFALEGTIDVIGGVDYNGFERIELPLALNAYLYVNPRSKVQFYFLGGLHVSRAHVWSDSVVLQEGGRMYGDESSLGQVVGVNVERDYSYFGGQGGAGLEIRLTRLVALNFDLLGFIRSRTDDSSDGPEYVDWNTGRGTNTSGGALFRGGLTFWF